MRCDTMSVLFVRYTCVYQTGQWSNYIQTPLSLDQVQFLSVFLSCVSVSRWIPDRVYLCLKIVGLKIGAKQRTVWLRQSLLNSVFTQSAHWDVMWLKVDNSVGNPSVSNRAKGQNLPSPHIRDIGYNNFFSRVSVARQNADCFFLCLKTEVVTIENQSHRHSQRANWLVPTLFDELCIFPVSTLTEMKCDTKSRFM